MASNDMGIFNTKPAKGTGEKKKRKRPSKKVPTTVLEASSNNFMNLVQKLTGSADEPNHHAQGSSSAPKSASPTPSPYSSPSNHAQHEADPPHQTSYYQQYLRSSDPAPFSGGYSSHHDVGMGATDHHQHSSSYGYENYGGSSYVGSGSARMGNSSDDREDYQGYGGRYGDEGGSDHSGYPSSSRAMENDISPFSWRDPMNHNSTSDYWYHVDPLPSH